MTDNEKLKEDTLSLIHNLSGLNMPKQQFISENINKDEVCINMFEQDLFLVSIFKSNVLLQFILTAKYVDFKIYIGKLLIKKHQYSYKKTLALLKRYVEAGGLTEERLNDSLKPYVNEYLNIYDGVYAYLHSELILEKDNVNDIENQKLNHELKVGEYLLDKEDFIRYISITESEDDDIVIDIETENYVTYIRNGGGNIFYEYTDKINSLDMMIHHLKSLAKIDNEKFIKALMVLEFNYQEDTYNELEERYQQFMNNEQYFLSDNLSPDNTEEKT